MNSRKDGREPDEVGPESPVRQLAESFDAGRFESVARFQSLQAGQYWRAQRDIVEEGIDEGTVLLIQSIRWVEEVQHTIILRPHPSKIGKRVYLQVPQEDGTTRRVHFVYDEHRFLLNDFLGLFEFEPDHQRIRAEEVRSVQGRINALQNELLETQSQPALMQAVVEDGLKPEQPKADAGEQAGVSEETPEPGSGANVPALTTRASDEAASLATGTVADAIGSRITSEGVAAMKAVVSREHQIATIKANWIEGKTTAIAEAIMEMTPYYQEQAAAALAHTEDVRSYVTKLLRGIESLDLYVGKDVEVVTVREGASAPRDVPLTFVQRKLLMDEELAVWTDIDQWFDFEKEDLFFDALRMHDGLIEQIFPTQRCVLVMAVTRRYIDYGDKWANNARNDENRKVFLLVRNGMNIHRVFSPVESHLSSARLFPTQDDQERVFRGFDGSEIKFQDVAYTDKLADHERFALHYKRFLLLVCGLDHRLKLFGDFYEGPQSMHFVSMEFQERHCHFLHDDDESRMLPGEDRPTVDAWIEAKNAYMRSGSRVLCNWSEVMNPDTAPGACKASRDRSYGRGFDRRYDPEVPVNVAIVYRDGKSLCVEVKVSGYSYSSHGEREFNCKVNLSKFKDGGRWDHVDLAFLCLDAIEPEELLWYIQHRGSRRNHLTYIRFFKQALKHIERERLSESDSRNRLIQALADGQIGEVSERPAIAGQAVVAWRAANRGKDLPRFEGGVEPEAWKALLDQMYMLAGEGKRRVTEIEAFALASGLEPLRLVLSGGAKLVLYAAAPVEERDDRLEPHAWVHRIGVERGKTKVTEKGRRWTLLPPQAASETTLHEWEGAAEWGRRTTAFSSFERKQQLMTEASRFKEILRPFTKRLSELEFEGELHDWSMVRASMLLHAKYVVSPDMAVPFGLVYFHRSKRVRFLCVGTRRSDGLLARLAPNQNALEQLRTEHVKPYKRKDKGRAEFDKLCSAEGELWGLLDAPVELVENRRGVFSDGSMGDGIEHLSGKQHSPLLSDWFDGWKAEHKDRVSVWLAEGATDADGRLALDGVFGIALPDDYEVVRIREFKLSGKKDLPKYNRWLDLCPGDDEGESRSFWASSGNDREFKLLVNSVTGGNDGIGYSSSQRVFVSRASARAAVGEWVEESFGDECRAVPWAELSDAPAPPDGIERWYVVDDE